MPGSARSSSATSGASEKAQRWLARSAASVGASRAVVLVRQGETTTTLALFPSGSDSAAGHDRALIGIAHRAFEERFSVLRGAADAEQQEVCVAALISLSSRPAVIAFRFDAPADASNELLRDLLVTRVLRREADKQTLTPNRRSESGSRPLLQHAAQAVTETPARQPDERLAELEGVIAEQGALLDVLASTLDQEEFDVALHALANTIARHAQCQRVSLGIVQGRHVRLHAVSGSVDFDPRSALMVDIGQAMEETYNAASVIRLPATDSAQVLPQNHVALAEQLKHPALVSLPLISNGKVAGVVLLERDTPFTDDQVDQLIRLSLMIGPVIALKQTQAMSAWQWARRYSARLLRTVFGPRYLTAKLIGIVCLALAVCSMVFTTTFRIDAEADIEATAQRAVVATFPSFISHVEKRAGDLVQQGDILAKLDVEDLTLDKIKWEGEREKLRKEYRANLVRRDRSKVRVLEAQQAQAQTQIDLIDAQLNRAVLRAPIDGVVVSGDLSQALGSPVERGELLFEVASLDDYRLVLLVDEQDIGWVEPGQRGTLRLRSMPEENFPFVVSEITPVSEPGNGVNSFRVEATFATLPESLRPGMGGYAKIDVEPKPIGWIWTRRFVDWVRVQAWKYGGL